MSQARQAHAAAQRRALHARDGRLVHLGQGAQHAGQLASRRRGSRLARLRRRLHPVEVGAGQKLCFPPGEMHHRAHRRRRCRSASSSMQAGVRSADQLRVEGLRVRPGDSSRSSPRRIRPRRHDCRRVSAHLASLHPEHARTSSGGIGALSGGRQATGRARARTAGRSRRRPTGGRWRSRDGPASSYCSRIGALKASSSSLLQVPPLASMPSRRTVVDSTLAACSPPITLMRAFGHIHRKRGA